MRISEKELIGKLIELRQIKPQKGWILLTKKEILGEEPVRHSFWSYLPFGFKSSARSAFKPVFAPVLAGLFVVLAFFGLFAFSQKSLPGDVLYVFKKIAERSQMAFIKEAEKPVLQLKLANQRLEDLANAPGKNLAPTIDEFQANVSAAVKNIVKIDAATSSSAIKKIVEETRKLEENKQKAESLGVVIGEETTSELNNALKLITANLIEGLEKAALQNEEKEIVLNQMKILFEKGNYSESLELYLINQ